jgi:hypothetical protein
MEIVRVAALARIPELTEIAAALVRWHRHRPEPNSRRLTSLKPRCFDNPANNVGLWPTSLGCTTNSYSSTSPRSTNASGTFTPAVNSPLPESA